MPSRLTKHVLPLLDLLRTEGRHEPQFVRKIGHVAGNILNACTERAIRFCERGASRFDRFSDLLRKRMCLVLWHSCLSRYWNPRHVCTKKERAWMETGLEPQGGLTKVSLLPRYADPSLNILFGFCCSRFVRDERRTIEWTGIRPGLLLFIIILRWRDEFNSRSQAIFDDFQCRCDHVG